MRLFPALLGCLVLAAGSEAFAQGPECPEERPDSLVRAVPPVYRACDVSRRATQRGGEPRLDFRPARLSGAGTHCYKATFRFVVDTVGNIDLPTIHLVQTSHADFAQSVRATLPALRYRTALLEGRPVRQVVEYERQMQVTAQVRVVGSDGSVSASPSPPRRLSARGC